MSRHGRFKVTKYSDDEDVLPPIVPPSKDIEMSTNSSGTQTVEKSKIKEPDVSEPRPFSCPTHELNKPTPRIPSGFQKKKVVSFALISKQPEHPYEQPSVSQSQEQNIICLRPSTPLPCFPEDLVFVFEEPGSNSKTEWVRFVKDMESRPFPFLRQIYIPMSLKLFLLQLNNLMESFSQTCSLVSKSGAQNCKLLVNNKAIEAAPKVIVLPEDKKESPKTHTEQRDNEIPGPSNLAGKGLMAYQFYTIDDFLDSDDESYMSDDSEE